MRGLWKLTRTEMKLFLREPMATFFTLVFPTMCLLLLGSMFGNKPVKQFGGLGFVDTMVPGYTAMIIATSGLLSLCTSIASYREKGILRRLRATPLQPQAILTAQVAVLFLMAVLGMALLIILGKLIYGLHIPRNPLPLLPAFLLCAMSVFAVGFVLASVLPTARTAEITAMALFFPMIFLSGAVIPQALPETVRRISQILPLTHGVTLLRGLWAGGTWCEHLKEVCVLSGVFVVGVIVSAKTFRWE